MVEIFSNIDSNTCKMLLKKRRHKSKVCLMFQKMYVWTLVLEGPYCTYVSHRSALALVARPPGDNRTHIRILDPLRDLVPAIKQLAGLRK